MDEVRNVILGGELGRKFGRIHKLAVSSPAEAVRALTTICKGFREELLTSADRGVDYAVFVGKTNIDKDSGDMQSKGAPIRISPVIRGSKQGGILQIIVGVILVAWSFFPQFGGNPAMFNVGVAMIAGGVIQLLSPQQGMSQKDQIDNGTSYNFNGAVNVSAQGICVPVVYGRMTIGSAVISASLVSEDKQ